MVTAVLTIDQIAAMFDPTKPFRDFIASAPVVNQQINPITALFVPSLVQPCAAQLFRRSRTNVLTVKMTNDLWHLSRLTADVGYIYFVLAPELQRVKIGFSRDFTKRFAALRNGSPCELEILGAVKAQPIVETILHRHCQRAYAYGEWFHYDIFVQGVVSAALAASTFDPYAVSRLAAEAIRPAPAGNP